MCGFLTVVSDSYEFKTDISKLKKAASLISHRGPDDSYEYIYKSYYSVFHRLSIRDLSDSSRQPIESPCGNFIICFNGEIFNTNEIVNKWTDLNGLSSDTLIISHLISLIGIDALNYLRGMFAISVYDKSNNNLYFSRDSLGIKPLYYLKSKNNKFFAISSEIKVLISLIEKPKPDINQCLRFLSMGICHDQEHTFFKNIIRVPPGFILKFSNNKIINIKKLDSNLNNIELKSSDPWDSYKHTDYLNNIIKDHLISDVPLSTTISGGIDSSLISAFCLENAPETNMFTASSNFFESEISIEREKKLGEKLINIDCSLDSPIKYIESIINKLSSPFSSSSWIFQDILMQKISKSYCYKVLLVGEGADEIYSGYKRLVYPYLHSLKMEGKLDIFEKSICDLQKFLGISVKEIIQNYKNFSHLLNKNTDYEDAKYAKYFNFNNTPIEFERYFPSEKQIDSKDPNTFYKSHLLSYLQRADIPSTLYTLDSISMSYSMELRVPFLDTNLISEVFKYDYKNHFESGLNKFMLRKSSKLLDDSVRWNPVKRQRPSITNVLIYELLSSDLNNILEQNVSIINTDLIKRDFNRALLKSDKSTAHLWFRIYTFLKFWSNYF